MTMSDYQYPETLPVTTTGGWARPGWWDVAANGEKEGRFGPADRQELLDDYCQLAIYDQESAGLDMLTDGEHHSGLNQRGEPLGSCSDFVGAREEVRRGVKAVFVDSRLGFNAGTGVSDGDRRLSEAGSAWVGDDSGERGSGDLRIDPA